jgi:hypothetical protein
LTTTQGGKRIKDKRERVFGSTSNEHYITKRDEIYHLAKDQALVKKLENKRFMPFCLCPPGVMFVTYGFKNSLFYVADSLFNLDCGQ